MSIPKGYRFPIEFSASFDITFLADKTKAAA